MLSRLAVLATLAAVLTASAPAHAGGPPGTIEPMVVDAPPPPVKHRTVHYGYQTFLADVAWVAAAGLAAKADADGSILALGYYGAAPLVHLAHHNNKAAARSLGLRVLLPVLGGAVGMMAMADQGEFGPLAGMMYGFGLGAIGAMVIDWTVLSKQDVEVKVPNLPALAVRPGVKIGKHDVTVSIAGNW
jgi:hypothetical protein